MEAALQIATMVGFEFTEGHYGDKKLLASPA